MVSCDEDSLRLWNRLPVSQFASGKLATILPSREILCVRLHRVVATEVRHLVLVGICQPAGSEYSTDTL